MSCGLWHICAAESCSFTSGASARERALLRHRRYGTYKLVQKMAGGEKLVAFTRILHRQTPDILMDEARSRAAQVFAL